MARCLSEAMPHVLESAVQALKPERSMLSDCTSILSEVESAIGALSEHQLKLDEGEATGVVPSCTAVAQSALEKIKSMNKGEVRADVQRQTITTALQVAQVTSSIPAVYR